MNNVLIGLEPNKVFYYFEEICKIPHGSGNTKEISDYCFEFAKSRGLQVHQDELNNIIIIKEATSGREMDAGVVLQGHLDMVAEKKACSDHDCNKDGLKLVVEGDFISALNTTLGADDGIAIAYALAILDSNELSHPRLEVILTVDEEIGMLGASYIDLKNIKGKYLLNIDSEEEGIFLTGCAGGATVNCNIPVMFSKVKGYRYQLSVSGLKGGHSGMEIDKERGNANILMGRVLYQLNGVTEFYIENIVGGFKDNAIPRESSVTIVMNTEEKERIDSVVKKMDAIFKKEFIVSDPNVSVTMEALDMDAVNVISTQDRDKLILFLINCPNGMIHKSQSVSTLTETSLNLGILNIVDEKIHCSFSVRSSVKERKEEICEKLKSLTEYLGGSYAILGSYPEWEYNPDSKLLPIMSKVYKQMFKAEPVVETIHAGLECGYIKEKCPYIDIVSFGPNIYDIHTTEERLSISSTQRVYSYLLEVLKCIK